MPHWWPKRRPGTWVQMSKVNRGDYYPISAAWGITATAVMRSLRRVILVFPFIKLKGEVQSEEEEEQTESFTLLLLGIWKTTAIAHEQGLI